MTYKRDRWVRNLQKEHKNKVVRNYLLVGDIHGCADEFHALLDKADFDPAIDFLIPVGDLGDRGPNTPDVFKTVIDLYFSDSCLPILGNHDYKLLRFLKTGKGNVSNGMKKALDQFTEDGTNLREIALFLENLPVVIEASQFIAVHGAYNSITEKDGEILSYALYGETTGRKDEFGYPERSLEWIQHYEGHKDIVHGHIVVDPCPEINKSKRAKVYDIDGGCVFGHELVGIKYPSREVVKVQAANTYYGKKGNRAFTLEQEYNSQ